MNDERRTPSSSRADPTARRAADLPTSDQLGSARPPAVELANEWIGSWIGPYRLLERLGEGGFGTVFRAEQEVPVRRVVALKIIKLGMDTRTVVARFDQERQALAVMDHPHIAKVFDAGATPDGRPYFVMEFCRGEPITSFCDRHCLTVDDRLRLFLQVCGAVQHAHQKGIIHRDIKPTNILVSLQDDIPFARVIDFGIAKATGPGLAARPELTTADQLIGTPEFMSPEQAEGSADIDTRSDVYSLGVLLHTLLVGTTPVDGTKLRAASLAELRRLICDVDPPPPSRRLEESNEMLRVAAQRRGIDSSRLMTLIRGDLDWIVLRALEKERTRRYPSAQELGDDVARHLAGEPVLAAPPSLRYRLVKAIRRHRALSAAGALMLFAVLAGSLLSAIGFVQADRERVRAERSEAETQVVVDFLSEMLESVEPGNRGREVTMRQVLDAASGSIAERFTGMPNAEARLRRTIGNAYRALGQLGPADDHLSVAADLRRRELGDRHPATLRAIADLAGLRQEQGLYVEAERLAREVLDGPMPEGFGREAIGVRNNLAQTLARVGRLPEALEMQRLAVSDFRRAFGPAHRHTIGSTANLALMLEALGRAAEAEQMLVRGLADAEEALGPNDPTTIFAASQLAGLRLGQGRLAEAEATYRDTIRRQVAILGPRHPDTARSQSSLGVVLARLGRHDEARELLAASWSTLHAGLGPEHADTITAAINLLEHEQETGWRSDTGPDLASVLASLRHVAAGPGATTEVLNTAAWFLLTVEPESLRDPRAALQAAQLACARAREAGEAGLWSYLDTLALAHARSGNWQAAIATQREALSLLPASEERYRSEMSQRLAGYEASRDG